MTGWNPILDRDVGEQGAAALLLASHPGVCGCPILAGVGGFFCELLGLPRIALRCRTDQGTATMSFLPGTGSGSWA